MDTAAQAAEQAAAQAKALRKLSKKLRQIEAIAAMPADDRNADQKVSAADASRRQRASTCPDATAAVPLVLQAKLATLEEVTAGIQALQVA